MRQDPNRPEKQRDRGTALQTLWCGIQCHVAFDPRGFYEDTSHVEKSLVSGMGLTITRREADGITLVDIAGRLDSSASGQVMDQLNDIVTTGVSRLVVNLAQVSYISSAGLRSILVAAKLLKSANGEMRLCQPNDFVKKTLEDSGFANLIRIDDHEGQSIAALKSL
jgi:anti-anti-sigma factor